MEDLLAIIVDSDSESVTVQVKIPLSSKGMLPTEENIQKGVNQAGLLATRYALSQYDTDGSPIRYDGKKYTGKGYQPKIYQCPFGEFALSRYVYQSNSGGHTFCPLERDARIIIGSTPQFSKMVSSKYAQMSAGHVQRDLAENHQRHISPTYIQTISQMTGLLAEINQGWEYDIAVDTSAVSCIGVSLDGTCMLMCSDGWRLAMVGSISLYAADGERLHTIYVAQPPEHGKEEYYKIFKKEIERVLEQYPGCSHVGIADGAPDNWVFLQPFVSYQIVDYFHASEYISKVAGAAFKRKFQAREWITTSCHTLKYEPGGAKKILKEMQGMIKKKITDKKKEIITQSITYFTNHLHQMDYPTYMQKNMPIGSGVIEAACKVIIKQRMCNSGMKWTDASARSVLFLRTLNETDGRWTQFWEKINRNGVNIK
jgi:hypothetical protein